MTSEKSTSVKDAAARTVFPVVIAISVIHFLNDTMQIVVPAVLPIVRETLTLSFTQIGLVLFVLNMTSSVLQPLVGLYSDRRPSPYLMPLGMLMSMCGIAGIALSPNFILLLLSVVLIGLGSACFHPEGSKVVFLAAGNRRGLAQSIYQVGGNAGSSMQSLLTRYIFIPFGQLAALWFMFVAGAAIIVSFVVSRWYKANMQLRRKLAKRSSSSARSTAALQPEDNGLTRKAIAAGLVLLMLQMVARSTYITFMHNYYQYYYAEAYASTLLEAQLPLFLFSIMGVVGTFVGGPLADKFGLKNVIFGSMIGAAPLALLLPYVGQIWAIPLLMLTGFIIMLGFAVIVVYAQMLLPGHIGMASGLTIGLSFGLGAIGAVAIGYLIDNLGLHPVFVGSSLLPLFGIFAYKLPDLNKRS